LLPRGEKGWERGRAVGVHLANRRAPGQGAGLLDVIERPSGRAVVGFCPLYLPIDRWGFRVLMTDFARVAYYAPNLVDVDVVLEDALGA